MSIDILTVLDTQAQTEAINTGLAVGALLIAVALTWAALEWRKHRREVRARAAVRAARDRAALRDAARRHVTSITNAKFDQIIAHYDEEAR